MRWKSDPLLVVEHLSMRFGGLVSTRKPSVLLKGHKAAPVVLTGDVPR